MPRNTIDWAKARRLMEQAIDDSAQLIAEDVLAEAQQRAPKDMGDLRASGGCEIDRTGKRTRITVYFTEPYAAIQHERTDFHHEDGEAKYLSNAIKARAPRIAQTLAKEVAESMRRGR